MADRKEKFSASSDLFISSFLSSFTYSKTRIQKIKYEKSPYSKKNKYGKSPHLIF
jgi:hypothetical protein